MDEIRRAYIKMGPYQPIKKEYPPTKFISQNRRFQSHWFQKFTWLEYSPLKDDAFCFSCFLFEHKHPRNLVFTIDRFKYWKRANDGDRCAFLMHIGCNTSPHNNDVEYLANLMNISRHIDKVINAQSSEEKQKNRLRLTATIESIRWLTLQACAFKGCMAIVLRFVDTEGFLRERFFAIVHVTDTTAATLKKEISDALGRYDLHIHNMRGQGYDGASNMRGSWNGLQALFLKDCSCAYYVHCFAHQLQLALLQLLKKRYPFVYSFQN
ncbi:uncharacterized protein [Primulina eburnea]|uniref:uncharacterized protein n=1 Tax=Primulina eburnea TaxID=1245227 RepID=UPI003C6C1795